jgi:hypothetical protein
MASVCLRGERDAEQIEGAALGVGRGGKDGGEAIAPKADDIAGERGEIAKQGMELIDCRARSLGPGVPLPMSAAPTGAACSAIQACRSAR